MSFLYHTERFNNYSEDAVTEGTKIFEKISGIFTIEILHIFVWLCNINSKPIKT